jgi:hypothetical protein
VTSAPGDSAPPRGRASATVMSAPWRWTTSLTIASPSPLPSTCVPSRVMKLR